LLRVTTGVEAVAAADVVAAAMLLLLLVVALKKKEGRAPGEHARASVVLVEEVKPKDTGQEASPPSARLPWVVTLQLPSTPEKVKPLGDSVAPPSKDKLEDTTAEVTFQGVGPQEL